MMASLSKKATLPAVVALVLGLGAVATTGVDAQGQEPAKGKTAKSKAAKIDLNTASAEELSENLPGVGAVTAKKIVDGRPYASVDDLEKAGVPARVIQAIRDQVTVAPPPAAKAKSAGAGAEGPAAPKAKAAPAGGKVNLNTATADELQTLPGVGAATAEAIVAARPFKSVDDLERVRGLGEVKIRAMRDLVAVDAPAVATTKTAAPATTKTAPTKTAGKAARAKAAEAEDARPSKLKAGQIVNLNTASQADLELLPGIGPVKAQAIIEARPFKTKEDVMKVVGIKEGIFARIRDYITVE